MKFIRPFWISFFVLLAGFLLGVGINTYLDVPATGVARLFAFIPFFILCGMKAKTFFE